MMTLNERLAELKETTAELEKLIGKLEMLHEIIGGLLGEAATVVTDAVNMTRWASEEAEESK
jgi:hypothetical protein